MRGRKDGRKNRRKGRGREKTTTWWHNDHLLPQRKMSHNEICTLVTKSIDRVRGREGEGEGEGGREGRRELVTTS